MSAIATIAKMISATGEGVKMYKELKAEVGSLSDAGSVEQNSIEAKETGEGIVGEVNNNEKQGHYELTKDIEKAPCDEIKVVEAGRIIDSVEELSPERWKNLSVSRKEEVLQGLENRLAAASHRPACKVRIEKMNPNWGGFHNSDGIALNADRVDNPKNVVRTLLHEGRHEYQTYNINLLKKGVAAIEPSGEKVESWRINMEDLGYENGECGFFDFRKIGLKRYFAQPVEVDARVFAETSLTHSRMFA